MTPNSQTLLYQFYKSFITAIASKKERIAVKRVNTYIHKKWICIETKRMSNSGIMSSMQANKHENKKQIFKETKVFMYRPSSM